jgi:hypothetical protein
MKAVLAMLLAAAVATTLPIAVLGSSIWLAEPASTFEDSSAAEPDSDEAPVPETTARPR